MRLPRPKWRYPEDFWVCVVFLLAALMVAAILKLSPAHGHDGRQQMDQWYRSLLAPDGTSCCNMRDCSPVDARIEGGAWQVRLDNAWVAVPPEVVLRRENQDGRPIACVIGGIIKCFVAPSAA